MTVQPAASQTQIAARWPYQSASTQRSQRAVDDDDVPRGPMRVAVDQARITVLAQHRFDGCRRDVHDGHRLSPASCPSLSARMPRDDLLRSASGCARNCRWYSGLRTCARKSWYSTSSVHSVSPCISSVRRAVEVEQRRVRQAASRRRRAAKRSPDQEVAVAVHEVDRHAGVVPARAAQPTTRRIEGIVEVVVADPVLEQVAEDVERLGVARRCRAGTRKNAA